MNTSGSLISRCRRRRRVETTHTRCMLEKFTKSSCIRQAKPELKKNFHLVYDNDEFGKFSLSLQLLPPRPPTNKH